MWGRSAVCASSPPHNPSLILYAATCVEHCGFRVKVAVVMFRFRVAPPLPHILQSSQPQEALPGWYLCEFTVTDVPEFVSLQTVLRIQAVQLTRAGKQGLQSIPEKVRGTPPPPASQEGEEACVGVVDCPASQSHNLTVKLVCGLSSRSM